MMSEATKGVIPSNGQECAFPKLEMAAELSVNRLDGDGDRELVEECVVMTELAQEGMTGVLMSLTNSTLGAERASTADFSSRSAVVTLLHVWSTRRSVSATLWTWVSTAFVLVPASEMDHRRREGCWTPVFARAGIVKHSAKHE